MRTTIFLSPPEGQTWPLDVDAAEHHFRDRWPSIGPMRGTGYPAPRRSIDFDVPLEGQPVSVVYQDGGPLVLNDGTPDDWADTIAWFLALLPPDASVVTMTDVSPSPVPLERTASVEHIRWLLDELNGESTAP